MVIRINVISLMIIYILEYRRKTLAIFSKIILCGFSFILPPATFISECFQDQCPATDAASNTEYFQLVVLYFSGS